MSELVKISNDFLKVKISTKGAELKSIIKDGRERLWQGDPDVWSGQAPVLFPICGGLKDGKYILDGKEYFLEKHGFAKKSEFEVETAEKDRAVFLLKSTAETIEKYPFEFEFRAIFSLEDNKLKVQYAITNLASKDMYCGVGGHEAYSCPEGVEAYSIVFDQAEDLYANLIEDGYVSRKTQCMGKAIKELPLKNEHFAIDAIILFNLKSRKSALKNMGTGEMVKLDFEGHDFFLIWTKPGAKYVCLEPWTTAPDFNDSDYDFTKKDGIIIIPPLKTETRTHVIEF